eukprot:TRINITY_DN6256_c0_g1_i1.p1 TRINITY_DN6256_c0_g1~~TRINITY_DN6256_c0_g1_i1.p1  ORF type:complete len:1775 (+),score=532.70 TRINITY_DN6256_c0_g1_i1:55-5325(+)
MARWWLLLLAAVAPAARAQLSRACVVNDCGGSKRATAANGTLGKGCTCVCRDQWTNTQCQTCPTPQYKVSGGWCNSCANGRGGYPTCNPCPAIHEGANCEKCKGDRINHPTCTQCTPALVAGGCAAGQGTARANGAKTSCYCKCSGNYAGANCDTCKAGYINFPTCTQCTSGTHCSGRATSVATNAPQTACVCTCRTQYVAATGCSTCLVKWNSSDPSDDCGACADDHVQYGNGTGGMICIPCAGRADLTPLGTCNGNSGTEWSNDGTLCYCDCNNGYDGDDCGSCAAGWINYPTCRQCTSAIDCTNHAAKVHDDGTRTSCVCTQCRHQWTGSTCAVCPPPYQASPDCKHCLPGHVGYPTCTQCDVATHCNSNAASVTDDGARKYCVCTCTATFDPLDDCGQCVVNYTGYPSCAECTVATDCNGKATAVTSTDAHDDCDCSCLPGYDQIDCSTCANGFVGYPNCVASGAPTTTPTRAPSATPSSEPSRAPSATPSRSPIRPTASPTAEPSRAPSTPPSMAPSLPPTATPSRSPSLPPTAQPSRAPSLTPSAAPSVPPTVRPSSMPTGSPSAAPSRQPSLPPTAEPSTPPTVAPTRQPSLPPTTAPTLSPSRGPSARPSLPPTAEPSVAPTRRPSARPSVPPSREPSTAPSRAPSKQPATASPSTSPSRAPSTPPTSHPSTLPTTTPSGAPTTPPTLTPTRSPSLPPSRQPSVPPSVSPSLPPSPAPSTRPTSRPSRSPSLPPTRHPTRSPSASPTLSPTTSAPTSSPTRPPSVPPTVQPSRSPSLPPTLPPTRRPSLPPTRAPSRSPSTSEPSRAPSTPPTTAPSAAPSLPPTALPSTRPTTRPSAAPSTSAPSAAPSRPPTAVPTVPPSTSPSALPSVPPTGAPSAPPSLRPSLGYCAPDEVGFPDCRKCSTDTDCSSHASRAEPNADQTACLCTCLTRRDRWPAGTPLPDAGSAAWNDSVYAGSRCDSCGPQFLRYPTCEGCTVANNCSSGAVDVTLAGGSCRCTCHPAYAGHTCTECAAGFTRDGGGKCVTERTISIDTKEVEGQTVNADGVDITVTVTGDAFTTASLEVGMTTEQAATAMTSDTPPDTAGMTDAFAASLNKQLSNSSVRFVTLRLVCEDGSSNCTSSSKLRFRVGSLDSFSLSTKEKITIKFHPRAFQSVKTGWKWEDAVVHFSIKKHVRSIPGSALTHSVLEENPGAAFTAAAPGGAGKLNLVAKLASCPNDPDETPALGFTESPFGVAFGPSDASKAQRMYFGAAVMNTLVLFPACALGHLLLSMVVWKVRIWVFGNQKASLMGAMSWVLFPGWQMLPVLLFFQGTLESALRVLYYGGAVLKVTIIPLVVLLAICFPLLLQRATSRPFFKAVVVPYPRQNTTLRRMLFGSETWACHTDHTWVNRFGMVFWDFTPRCQNFILFETAAIVGLSLMGAFEPIDFPTCVLKAATITAVLLIQLGYVLLMRPFLAFYDTFTYFSINAFQTLGAGCALVMIIRGEDADTTTEEQIAGACTLGALMGLILKSLCDFLLFCFEGWEDLRAKRLEKAATVAQRNESRSKPLLPGMGAGTDSPTPRGSVSPRGSPGTPRRGSPVDQLSRSAPADGAVDPDDDEAFAQTSPAVLSAVTRDLLPNSFATRSGSQMGPQPPQRRRRKERGFRRLDRPPPDDDELQLLTDGFLSSEPVSPRTPRGSRANPKLHASGGRRSALGVHRRSVSQEFGSSEELRNRTPKANPVTKTRFSSGAPEVAAESPRRVKRGLC